MDALEKYYKESLIANLCPEYKGFWQRAHNDKEQLVKLAMGQQAIPHVAFFAYDNRGLTKDYLKSEFTEYINGYTVYDADGVKGYTYGLYVDYDYDNDLVVDKDVIHIMWSRDVSILVPTSKCPTLYVSNGSKVHLECEGYNSITLYLFDDSEVVIEDADNDCSVTVFRYSKDSKVETGKFCLSTKVNIFDKELRL